MAKLRVTVDPETVPPQRVEHTLRIAGGPYDLALTRSWPLQAEGTGGASPYSLQPSETLPADEAEYVEAVLAVISNGTFPPSDSRQRMTAEQKNLRHTARVLYLHQREPRDVFVTDNARVFGEGGSLQRQRLSKVSRVKLMTSAEFQQHYAPPAR